MMDLSAEHNGTVWCECGNRKRASQAACKRCTYLDQQMAAGLVIAALRNANGLSLRDLCVAVYGYYTHSNATGMLGVMQRLVRERRVRRYLCETDTFEMGTRSHRGSTWALRMANGGHWVYVLDGRTESGR